MNSVLTFICLISTLTAKGYSLSCTKCTDATGTSCSGQSEVCTSDVYACGLANSITLLGGIEVSKLIVKQCIMRDLCDRHGSMTIPNGHVKSSTTCCSKDNCEPAASTFPSINTTKNGVVCMGCMNIHSKTCNSDKTIECTGNEKKCIHQSTVITVPVHSTSSFSGCVSEELCITGTTEINFGNLETKIYTSCSDGASGVHHNLFMIAFASITVFKLTF